MEKFSYEANGYNRVEVNQFVSDVITQTEGIIKRCREQRSDIEKLKAELEHYRNLEKTLNFQDFLLLLQLKNHLKFLVLQLYFLLVVLNHLSS